MKLFKNLMIVLSVSLLYGVVLMMMNQSIMVIQQSHYRPIYSKWIKMEGMLQLL